MKSISIDIPVSSLVWLATCRPEDAASFLRLLLAMSQHPSAPASAIDLAAIPPTVDWNALVNAGAIACDGKTVSVPGLRKLYEDRKRGRSRALRAREVRRTCAERTAHVTRTPPSPLSPPHTPPLTPQPPEVNNIARVSGETGWAKDLLDEAARMLGRQPNGSETHRLVGKIVELEAMPGFVVDGEQSEAGAVYVACLRWVTNAKGVNSGVVPWLNYADPVFDQCRRTGLGPGKMKRANPGGTTIVGGEVSSDLEAKLAAKLAAKNGGIK